MDEVVDIVNEADEVIGFELKSICHKKGIQHRGSNIFVFRDDSFKEILIQQRSKSKLNDPLLHCTPGGHVGKGESYEEGAKRELSEEQFNSDLDNNLAFEELFKIKKETQGDHEFIKVFRVVSEGPFANNPKEVETSFFKDIREVVDEIKTNPELYTATTLLLLKKYSELYM